VVAEHPFPEEELRQWADSLNLKPARANLDALALAMEFAYRRGAKDALSQLLHDGQALLDQVDDEF
jgi:hypothetical protein